MESARQAKRSVTVAWVGSAVNALVVIAAFAVPALQRQWSDSDKFIDQRQQDMRAISAGYSQLTQMVTMLSSGGLLEPSNCDLKKGFNSYDSVRLKSIETRLNSLNQAIYDDGVKTGTQVEMQAAMIRVHDSFENAMVTATSPADRSLTFAERANWCKSAIADVAAQARDLKVAIQSKIVVTYLPVKSGWLGLEKDGVELAAVGKTLSDEVANIVIPNIEDPFEKAEVAK